MGWQAGRKSQIVVHRVGEFCVPDPLLMHRARSDSPFLGLHAGSQPYVLMLLCMRVRLSVVAHMAPSLLRFSPDWSVNYKSGEEVIKVSKPSSLISSFGDRMVEWS